MSGDAKPVALVVDDEPNMATIVEFALQTQGFEVVTTHSGVTALMELGRRSVDLVVLDVMMSAMDGLTVCRRIRDTGSDVPIMLLTALGQQSDVINGLEHGADDYVSKPFHPRELALRAQALVRRRRDARPVLRVGGLAVDQVTRLATLDETPLSLPFTEFKLLAFLVSRAGAPQSWQRLLEEVWGTTHLVGGRDLVKSTVYRLRSRLAALPGGADYIRTVRGVGYLVPVIHDRTEDR